jgi:glycosyltransferase involved in cell wall biosynthesis
LRIGAILPHLLVFGGVRRYLELGNAFVSRGHQFTIFTPDGMAPDWISFTGEVKPLDSITKHSNDITISGSPELIDWLDTAPSRIRIFYLQLEGVHGEDDIVRSGKYTIMVNSGGLARRIQKRYGIAPLNGIGGVNPELFHPVETGRSSGPFRILCYGRLSRPRKGARFVIQAARWMRSKGYDVELSLFDTMTPAMPDPRIGFDPGVPYRFYMNLPQARMASMYSECDVFVSAEHRAGWSNTAAEAAACSLPLVCTESGTGDFAIDGESALVLERRAAGCVRRSLIRLYRDRALGKSLGERARRNVLAFTWDALCDRMDRTFREMLQ